MRVVGHHERSVAADGDPAIGADAAFAQDAVVPRFAVRPELPPGGCVQRVDLVPPGDVHDAVLHHGGRLKRARIARNRKHPRRAEALHVGRVDQLERTVPIAGETAVVVRPVRFRRDRLFHGKRRRLSRGANSGGPRRGSRVGSSARSRGARQIRPTAQAGCPSAHGRRPS